MIGQIALKRRQETSYNGERVSVLKSGIQKYVRRGMLEKGLWCLVELDLFQLIECTPEGQRAYLRHLGPVAPGKEAAHARAIASQAMRLRTNLINRLLVMVPEEISISSFWMPLVIDGLYESWKATRGRPESRKYLVDIYKYLVAAKKIRLISDIRSVYLLPPDQLKSHQLQDLRRLHRRLLESLGLSCLPAGEQTVPEDLLSSCTLDLGVFLDRGDASLAHIANGILYHLKIQSDGVFFWVRQLLDRQRDGQGTLKLGKQSPVNLLWELLLGFAERREGLWGGEAREYPENFRLAARCIQVLRKWYESMTHKEKPVYLLHAILLIVRRDMIDWSSEPPVIDTPWSEVEGLYKANLAGQVLALDDFVFDIHTGAGDQHGRERFASIGAAVVNEDRALLNAQYRLVYNALKIQLDAYTRGGMTEATRRLECAGD